MSAEGDAALVALRGVGKQYPVVTGGGDRLRTLWALIRRNPDFPHFTALRDIDLEVRPGESLGLIGENGAGKSTLLKIIAGVVKPSSGDVSIKGRIGALLELGAGFHPEYTGRENILLSAALMGLGRSELLAHIESIISFADIGEHIDQPIKHYSSGMVVRLGFAVATALRPDILITDEVLAVGDESFQKKCIRWMENYLGDGGTLLLCSHGMYHIQKLCQKALWLHQGGARLYGGASEVTREYLTYHEERERSQKPKPYTASTAAASGVYAVTEFWLDTGTPGNRVEMAGTVSVHGVVYSPDGREPTVAIGVVRAEGTPVYGQSCDVDGFHPTPLGNSLFGFGFRLSDIQLLPGRYSIRAHAMDPEGMRVFDTAECTLDVLGDTRELGLCRLSHAWLSGPPPLD